MSESMPQRLHDNAPTKTHALSDDPAFTTRCTDQASICPELPDYILQGCINHIHDIYGFRNIKLAHVSKGHSVIVIPTTKGFGNVHGRMHGGALMALCDISSGLTVYSLGKDNVTLSANFNFMRGVNIDKAKTIRCEGRVVHNGKRTCVVNVDVVDENGIVCVRGTFTQFVIKEITPDDPIPVSTQGTNDYTYTDEFPEFAHQD